MNDSQTYKEPDWERIAHLLKLGMAASLVALIGGDMLLGWRPFTKCSQKLLALTLDEC